MGIMNRLSRALRLLQSHISNVIRDLWLSIPIPDQAKLKFKDSLFSQFPFLFDRLTAYKNWQNFKIFEVQFALTHSDDYSSDGDNENHYVPFIKASPLENLPVKLIAFYLPQFHAIAENNLWWGNGFTEWSNVKPAQAQFEGHYQPHVPDELGYYDLLSTDIQKRQVELAKLYGVGGFCFYTYWFGGKLLLEKPVQNYLNDRSLSLPFCLCWANENWTRRWDGRESEMLIGQKHTPEDDLEFIKYIAQYMRDDRYIRIDGKPLLLVYRPHLLTSAKKTAERWRAWCKQAGIGEIYLAYTQSFATVDPQIYGFDAAIEFPPNNNFKIEVTKKVKPLNANFECSVYDWRSFVQQSRHYQRPTYKLFRGVCPAWDNTARRKSKGTIFINSSPQAYQEWLANAITETCSRIRNPDERLVFVNAWNEWAEGAHLEPDEKYGYAYLDATRKAFQNADSYLSGTKTEVADQ